MNGNLKPKVSGLTLALAAAGLIAGCAGGQSNAGSSSTASVEAVHCYGVNKCGGHNDCGTAKNDCAGKASCKGTGFVAMPTKACGDIGGEVKDDWKGAIAKSDLIHCYGVNKCGGHNDCGTASNDCAGKASCKGTGFVAMSSKACADVGGEKGA